MNRLLLTLAFFISWRTAAQIHPADGDTITYRIIGFKQEGIPANQQSVIEVANGVYESTDSFRKHILLKRKFTGGRVIAEVPSFATDYTWRISGAGKTAGPLHHFRVGYCDYVDSTKWRLRVPLKASKYKDAFVFVDGFGALLDMNGRPVWFAPVLNSETIPSNSFRDIKPTSANTITYLYKDKPYEINWQGDVLWSGAGKGEISHDKDENYHHDFSMLPNGHFMVLGNEKAMWPNVTPPAPMKFGTVIEYDKQGHITWYWRSSALYFNTDYVYNGRTPHTIYDVHQNAFALDSKRGVVWVSFKNVSQIVKVKYPEGKVLAVYGKNFNPGEELKPSLFYEQHSLHISQSGNLYFMDNHNPDNQPSNFQPRIVMVKEENGTLVPIWEFEYHSVYNTSEVPPMVLSSGGNVLELPDGAFFVSMCGPYSNLFIVTPQKDIVWEAIPEKFHSVNSSWRPISQYRSSIVLSRAALEKLVWGGQGEK